MAAGVGGNSRGFSINIFVEKLSFWEILETNLRLKRR